MQDLKRHASRKTPYRRKRSSSIAIRKQKGATFIQAKSRAKRHPPKNLLSFFRNPFKGHPDPEILRQQVRNLTRNVIGLTILTLMIWMGGGIAYIGWSYFQKPLKEIRVSGNQLLSLQEVLHMSGLNPGMLLSQLDPYQTAIRIQQHPVVRRADVRREFPQSVHLILHEHLPVVLVERSHPESYIPEAYWLISREKLVLQSISTERKASQIFRDFPRIKGLTDHGVKAGLQWNSLALERGLKFLDTVKDWENGNSLNSSTPNTDSLHSIPKFWTAKGLLLDLSDPLNLKLRWQVHLSKKNHQIYHESQEATRRKPVVVQLGREQYAERLKRFEKILPHLLQEHPEMKSVDLRYPDRITLVP